MNGCGVRPPNRKKQEFGLGGRRARSGIVGIEGWNKRAEGDDTYIEYRSCGFMASVVWFMFEEVGSQSAVGR